MGIKCEIKFIDNPLGIFYAGQTVIGKVELSIDRATKISGISLTVSGYAQAKWSDREKFKGKGGKSQTRTLHYVGREDYLKSITNLVGGTNDGKPFDIMPGIHSFDFQCLLPKAVPSSFEGKRLLVYLIVEIF